MVKIMTFNIWHNGKAGKQPLSQTVKVIEEANADIVGLQEADATTVKSLAEKLGWHHSGRILSRYTIAEERKNGIKVLLDSKQAIYVFNVHLSHAPYQPYQLLGIPYYNGAFIKTEKEAVAAAEKARGGQVTDLLKEINSIQDKDIPIFITGDFNEPSHLDWTEKAASAGRHPIKVAYPTTHALSENGFIDAYRAVYPDEMTYPGFTWTPTTKPDNPKDHHDRIDFVFAKGTGVNVQRVQIVGEDRKNADIVVTPYPSDHRSVVATYVIASPTQTSKNAGDSN